MTIEDREIVVEYVNQLLRVLLAAGFPRELAMRASRVLLHTSINLTISEIDSPPIELRRQQRSEREISFESLIIAEMPGREWSEFLHDRPEVFDNAVRWIIDGMEKELRAARR
jgi:hypothetical protein